jgi:precorrin-3B C17-methyltransferase
VVVGYKRYLDNIKDLLNGKEIISSGMTRETDRCMIAIQKAADGKTVSLVSSGDAGVYGMAGLALELAQETLKTYNLKIEIIAGVSAANAASAKLGAPLMLDYANISLSDLLVSWELIRKKLEAAASADFVVAIFNPKSKKRGWQLKEAAEIFRKYRPGITPVGVCTSVGYAGEEKTVLTDLDHFLDEDIGMMTTVIIGNRATRKMGNWMVTPRGYKGKSF